MKSIRFTSNKEHKLLLAVAMAAFIFSIAGFFSYTIKADIERSEYYRIQEENKANSKISKFNLSFFLEKSSKKEF